MKVYIAGFDVFAPDAVERGRRCREICGRFGLTGLYPLDNEAASAEEIYRGNIAMIDEADAVAANVNPFRGLEPDSGTAFEIGYAAARGKAVYLYLDDTRPLIEKVGPADKEGFFTEDFSLPVNLMLAVPSTVVQGSFQDCIARIAADCAAEDKKNDEKEKIV